MNPLLIYVLGLIMYAVGYIFLAIGLKNKEGKHSAILITLGITMIVEGLLLVIITKDPLPEVPWSFTAFILSFPIVSISTYFIVDTWREIKGIRKVVEYLHDFCPIFEEKTKKKIRNYIKRLHRSG
ncbi:hypothetical protein DRN86_03520 [Candidatus Geothermarchaeota archaeon]|nr:MAG: hypothetical protein DRN86_03520 [Candidatus Geothermarchaeota archaeon]